MTSKLNAAIILAAVLGMGAVGASIARAESSLDVGASPAFLTGSQETKNKLTITSASGETLTTVKCSTVSLVGTTSTISVTEFSLTPNYGEANTCELGGLAATTHSNGCVWQWKRTSFSLTWSTNLVCPKEKDIQITQGTCVITIKPPQSKETIDVANKILLGIKIIEGILNIRKLLMEGGPGCPANLQAAGITGDWTGTQVIKAFSDLGGVEGSQVSLEGT